MSADPTSRLTHALRDRYRIEREIGAGGMATVYLAYDLKHDRQVAIKVLQPEVAAAVGADRFLREIAIAAKLNYPHIVPLFDSGEADGLVFYVMPFVAGESLRDRLRRVKQLPVDEAISIAKQVAAALTHAASHGIIHRDIKPDNILLIDDTAMVADFGIARAVAESGAEHLTATGGIVGTPAYMSPEQASGAREIDARSDVYALGCVLYEMLAGEPPYTGPTVQSIVAQHLAAPVPQVRRLRDLVPTPVELVITRALAKLPADRIGSAHELAAALTAESYVSPLHLTSARVGVDAASQRRRPSARVLLGGAAGVAIVLLLLLNIGGSRDLLAGRSSARAAGNDGRQSVAVLPFQNIGAPDEEYFSDGLAEELIVALSQLPALRVAARTSAFAFKGQTGDLREVARALRVNAVLLGSVRKTDNRVRVTAQLVDASNGLDLWSETYDERNLSDIFDIQADVAMRIARALDAKLSASDRARLTRKPTENLEAYSLYLKGRHFWNRRGPYLATAIDYFNRAIAVDSQFARAYAGLASVYLPLGVHGYIEPAEGRERTQYSARRAVALDSSLAEAYTALGAYYHVYEWKFSDAERVFERAIQLDPNYPTAHLFYGFFLASLGRYEESLRERISARDLDPLAPAGYSGMGAALLQLQREDSAKLVLREAIELDPEYWQAYETLAFVLERQGKLDSAQTLFELAVAHAGRTARAKAGLARVLARSGRMAEARRLIAELRAQAAESANTNPLIATALFAVGDKTAAHDWLEAAYRQRHPDMVRLIPDPSYDAMRGEARFQDVVRRVGLPTTQ